MESHNKETHSIVKQILLVLDETYGTKVVRYLHYDEPWQLLIAVILSAQCTDARVNIVTKDLFLEYPSLEALKNAKLKDVERLIHSTGFYHNKAKNIIACARKLVDEYDSQLPRTLEELTGLPGVGRKTANVIRGNIYNDPSIVVDTHVKRISKKLGLTDRDDPTQVEMDLMKVLPKDHWILFNIQVIAHGRSICTARNPSCEICPLSSCCRYYNSLKK